MPTPNRSRLAPRQVAEAAAPVAAPPAAGPVAVSGPSSSPRPRRAGPLWLALFVVVVAAAAAGYHQFGSPRAAATLPTARARSGEFLAFVRCRGELIARRSALIVAPLNVPELRIIWLATAGEATKAGEPVVRFDPSSAQQQLAEKQAALEEADAKLEQAEADAQIAAEQDRLDLANARYEIERARLEVSKSEIISAMQAEQSRIALKLAEERLEVREATTRHNSASNLSKIASLRRAREEAEAEVKLTEYRLSRMELPAPIDGIIVYLNNYSQGWMNAAPFKVGDQVWPGGAVAEIPDLQSLEMEGKLEETDRGAVQEGDEVRVAVDSLPELSLKARLRGISPLTQQSFEWPPTKSFRGYAPIQDPAPSLRPGMAGKMDVVVDRIPNAVIVPAQAVFTKQGKPVVHVARGDKYRTAEIEILARNPDEFAISGIEPDTVIALVEPEINP